MFPWAPGIPYDDEDDDAENDDNGGSGLSGTGVPWGSSNATPGRSWPKCPDCSTPVPKQLAADDDGRCKRCAKEAGTLDEDDDQKD